MDCKTRNVTLWRSVDGEHRSVTDTDVYVTQFGYARVSKADGSQAHGLQAEVLAAADVVAGNIRDDSAAGRPDERPELNACLKARRRDDRLFKLTLAKLRLARGAMSEPQTRVAELCAELGVSHPTLRRHVTPMGQIGPGGDELLGRKLP